MKKIISYGLTKEQEKALYDLLYNINLEILHDTGEIILVMATPIPKKSGKVIFEMFYGSDFGEDV